MTLSVSLASVQAHRWQYSGASLHDSVCSETSPSGNFVTQTSQARGVHTQALTATTHLADCCQAATLKGTSHSASDLCARPRRGYRTNAG